ncbi:hypothetical protein AB0M05_41060 [Streptomyces violaceusniger]|uniref:DUF6919 domain-containing protein n=1 Tax=Streptomyces violaceusniger TaxID=68280 RepID=UPI0034236672
MSRADRARWRGARSIADLGGLTALWLEGKIASQPGYSPNYGPDEETAPLVPVLAAANRAGYLTDNSQPGLHEPGYDGRMWTQRAAVTGWVDRSNTGLMHRLREAAWSAGLILCTGRDCDGVTVTQVDGQNCIAFGETIEPSYLRVLWPASLIDPGCYAAVEKAHQVTLVDPRYGNSSRLWTALAGAIGYDWSDRWSELGTLRAIDGRDLDGCFETLGQAYARDFTHPAAQGQVRVVHYITRGRGDTYAVLRGLHHSFLRGGRPHMIRLGQIGVLGRDNARPTLQAAEDLARYFTAQVTPARIQWDGTPFPDGGCIDLPRTTAPTG